MVIIQPFFDATIESSPVSYIHRKPSPIKAPSSQEYGRTRVDQGGIDWIERLGGSDAQERSKGKAPPPSSFLE